MRKILCIVVLAVSIAPAAPSAQSRDAVAKAEISNLEGQVIGSARLVQAPTGVLIHVRVTGLKPGRHGLHLHGSGLCEPGEGFKTAKGHVGKVDGAHGLLNPAGPEPGDLPNLVVGSDGAAETELFTTLVSLEGGGNPLLDGDGTALVIHEGADDHVTQPIGGAGSRVACGVITPAD